LIGSGARGAGPDPTRDGTNGKAGVSAGATAFPSGSRTKLGELVNPRKASSCWKSPLMEALPWSWRMASPTAIPFSKLPNGGVTMATIRKHRGRRNRQTTLRPAGQSDATADAAVRARRWKPFRSP
jgi:hypothetical protein